jgi:predicted aldo/keto reductase-like oxidoreductase
MNYRKDKYGNNLSILGFGCMRFARKMGQIDLEEMEKEVMLAIDQGVNYFDTAYIYPGSEAALGQVLEKNGLRHQVNIATKLPHYLVRSHEGLDKLFYEELRRLRTDHVDYYLMHMLNDVKSWKRLQSLGIEDWIADKKAKGEIRQVGFSYHGNTEMFCRVVDLYDWDFCQIQYNYLDEHAQAGRRGLNYAHAKGLPVVIMEPLRGGKLVNNLPEKAVSAFENMDEKRSPAEWGLRWLWNQPEVTVVLSGMNSREMVQENIRTACEVRVGEQGEKEMDLYAQVVKAINEKMKVGCTACGYCQPCPKGVDIPGVFALYNRYHAESKTAAKWDYVKCTTLRKNSTTASQCIGCGKCEQHCPQGIAIREELKNARKVLEGPAYKVLNKALSVVTRF